ncbi:MAG: hypothetical protein EPO65_05770 [Dehalococcoidia bacterium]|nr:MAG: hypothetical protein EPO65_05770 [Dehalococcoidia bacterium]
MTPGLLTEPPTASVLTHVTRPRARLNGPAIHARYHPRMPTVRRLSDRGSTSDAAVTIGQRAVAFAFDLVYGALASLTALVVAAGWLLLRTAWGRDDVPSGDATFAAGVLLAATPAWLTWTALHLAQRGATPGQARAGLRVVGSTRRRLIRFSVHPLMAPGWIWLAILALVVVVGPVAVGLAAIGGAILVAGLVTAVLAVARPTARGLHDRIAGTRLAHA